MATFQVPQFIEQKAKIVGPLTLGQFAYVGAAGLLCFALFYVLAFWLWVIAAAFIGSFAAALAFVTVNGRRLPYVLFHALFFFWKPRMYTWRREVAHTTLDTSAVERLEALRRKMGVQERLQTVRLFVTARPRTEGQIRAGQEQVAVRHLTGETERARRVDYGA